MKIQLIFFVLFSLCSNSISNRTSVLKSNNGILIPLAAGNEWVYENEQSEKIPYWIDSTFLYNYQDTQIQMYSMCYDAGNWTGKFLWFYHDETLKQTAYWNIEPDNPELKFEFPEENGSSWINEYKFWGTSPPYHCIDTYSCNLIKEKVVVPAGDYQCYNYQIDRIIISSDSLNISMNYYFSPDVGLVAIKRTEIDKDDPGNTIEIWERKLCSFVSGN